MTTLGATIDHHRNGVSGVIDVVRNDRVPSRYAPGLSLHSGAELPRQLAVFTDGDATGVISDFDALEPPSPILAERLSALPYRLLQAPTVAVIDAAMDDRVQQAVTLGASRVLAIEQDPNRQAVYCGTYRHLNRTSCESSTVRWERLTARGFGAQARRAIRSDHAGRGRGTGRTGCAEDRLCVDARGHLGLPAATHTRGHDRDRGADPSAARALAAPARDRAGRVARPGHPRTGRSPGHGARLAAVPALDHGAPAGAGTSDRDPRLCRRLGL